MPPDERDNAYLWDMLHYARAIVSETAGKTIADYSADENFRLATERRMEIIGEAASRISQACRDESAHIPWRAIVAQRNVLAHAYGEIDDERVWNVVLHDIPKLISWLERLVAEVPPSL